jgi:hypothetical protein
LSPAAIEVVASLVFLQPLGQRDYLVVGRLLVAGVAHAPVDIGRCPCRFLASHLAQFEHLADRLDYAGVRLVVPAALAFPLQMAYRAGRRQSAWQSA